MEAFNLVPTLIGKMLQEDSDLTEQQCVENIKGYYNNLGLGAVKLAPHYYQANKLFDRPKQQNSAVRVPAVQQHVVPPPAAPRPTALPPIIATPTLPPRPSASEKTLIDILEIPDHAPRLQKPVAPVQQPPPAIAKTNGLIASDHVATNGNISHSEPTKAAVPPQPKKVAAPTPSVPKVAPVVPAVAKIVNLDEEEDDREGDKDSTKKSRGTADHTECAQRVTGFIAFARSTEYKAVIAEHADIVPVPDELLAEASDGLVIYNTDPNKNKAFIRSLASRVRKWVDAYQKQRFRIEKAKQVAAEGGAKKTSRKPKAAEPIASTTTSSIPAPAPQLLPPASIAAASNVTAESLVSPFVANLKSAATPPSNEKKRPHDQVLDKPATLSAPRPKSTASITPAPKKTAPPAPKKRKLEEDDDDRNGMDLDNNSEDALFAEDEEDDEEADFVDNEDYISGEEEGDFGEQQSVGDQDQDQEEEDDDEDDE